MNITWTKNLRARLGAVAAALLATVGLYGVIQAQPLGHSASAALDTATPEPAATATAAPSPAPIVFPARGVFATPTATLPPVPSATEPPNVSAPDAPGQLPHFNHPVTRTRAS